MLRRDGGRFRQPLFWDGVAWALRLVLVGGHLLFGIIAIVRPNLPLLFQGYSAFDDSFGFNLWGLWHLFAAVLLWEVPTRVPFGLISTLFSAFWLFFTGAMFWAGAELVFGSAVFYLFGALSLALFGRALWLYLVRVEWFQRRVLRWPDAG
ncbi:hypothetical protein GO986_16270 [Deinococcus sp. HMF7620]|uniref:Uncharacterized protein n=1 Tax=Deinococcus arboris TaxID=2682977 RepID=A0A7C9M3H9_9DEIO|nr:hypothetical protein [Deinococcus arboris]MVN88302.1 hypothetical protein [Deinococcus arboris]